jgi:SAM-dependent methyltransferase
VKVRGPWQGMLTIARLNWPFYAAAAVLLIASLWGCGRFAAPPFQLVCALTVAGSAYFVVGSLGVSHWVYDRSDLYRWKWLERALAGAKRDRMIFCHAGFDETSEALQGVSGSADWLVLDHFDETRMTEASIRRARQLFPPRPGTLPAPFDQWPAATESSDVIFGLLAVHEFRSEPERTAWFSEAKRCLRPGGRIVLAEHTRDLANFLAFGPGFLHFHSPASWRRCWERAGLRALNEFRVTPWVRIFVLTV